MQIIVRQSPLFTDWICIAKLIQEANNFPQYVFCKFNATINFASSLFIIFSLRKLSKWDQVLKIFWFAKTVACGSERFHKFISPYYLQPVISHSKSVLQTKSWQIISSQTQKFLWTQVWKIMLSNHTLTFLFVNIYHVNLLILHFPSFHWKN